MLNWEFFLNANGRELITRIDANGHELTRINAKIPHKPIAYL
jgi:hypothetical protein